MSSDCRHFSRSGSRGFTLIEVLVAVAVLSIGIFGLIALESLALQNNQSAYLRSQASVLIYDLADKMRANMEGDYEAAYGNAASHGTSCVSYSGSVSGSGCDADDIAERDMWEWQQSISSILPSGAGSVAVDASSGVTEITVSWDDDRDSTTSAATFSVEFEL